MKNWHVLFSLLVAPILHSPVGFAQSGSSTQNGKNELVGAWKLVELDRLGRDGVSHATQCSGSFIFSADGHLAVQVMETKPSLAGSGEADMYSVGGYEASYGTYTTDTATHVFTFHVEGALARNLIGKDLRRIYSIEENRLTVTSVSPEEHWRVIWERN